MATLAYVIVGLLLLGGLSKNVTPPPTEQKIVEESVRINEPLVVETSMTPLLREFAMEYGIPDIEKRIPIGVAEIIDATGKSMSDTTTTNSRVVTQAAELYMMKALQEVGLFRVLDRRARGFNLFMREQDLKGKKRLKNPSPPHLNKIIGAPFIVYGAITSFQFDVKTRGGKGKISGKGGEAKYAVATVQADFVLLNTTTSEVKVFSLIDAIEGKMRGIDTFFFSDGKTLIDIGIGGSREDVYDLVVRRLCEKAALEIAKTIKGVE